MTSLHSVGEREYVESMLVNSEDLYSDRERIRAWIMSVEGAGKDATGIE